MRQTCAGRLLFVVSLISLLALVAWWTVLMSPLARAELRTGVAGASAVFASDATHPGALAARLV